GVSKPGRIWSEYANLQYTPWADSIIPVKNYARGGSEEGIPARSRKSEAIEDARREAELTGPRAHTVNGFAHRRAAKKLLLVLLLIHLY
ncbi:MAG: hypothetical protein UT04_C0014G0022, partial [Candidatus Daviesbacteria bacterium GW2011_GWF2_38_7]